MFFLHGFDYCIKKAREGELDDDYEDPTNVARDSADSQGRQSPKRKELFPDNTDQGT